MRVFKRKWGHDGGWGGTVKRWLDQWVESSGGQKGY